MLFAPHRITQPTESFDILFLVNSLTIWFVLIVNDASVIERNCQHHFHLAPNLVFLFLDSEIPESSIEMTGLLFPDHTCSPKSYHQYYCLHEVCVLISTLQQISVYCKVHLFLLDCQHLWDKLC